MEDASVGAVSPEGNRATLHVAKYQNVSRCDHLQIGIWFYYNALREEYKHGLMQNYWLWVSVAATGSERGWEIESYYTSDKYHVAISYKYQQHIKGPWIFAFHMWLSHLPVASTLNQHFNCVNKQSNEKKKPMHMYNLWEMKSVS